MRKNSLSVSCVIGNNAANKSDRSADSLLLNLFGAAKAECNRRARSTSTLGRL
jgi:hypothetical protein